MTPEFFLVVQNNEISKIDFLQFLFKDGPFFQKFARSAIRTDLFSENLPVLL